MPLNRANVTVASRVMLPAYPILAAAVGANYLVAGDDLLRAAVVFRVANGIMPLAWWGLMFLIVAGLQVLALLSRSRLAYELALALMAGSMVTWGSVGLLAAAREGGSWTAALWPGFVAVACIASFRSLNEREA